MKKFNKVSKIGIIRTHELKDHFVREYENRLAIWRKDCHNQILEELQNINNKIWGNDCIAIELYPKESNSITVMNTRHL